MKQIAIFLLLLSAIGTQAQSRGYLVTMNDNDTIGVIGGKLVIFTQELDSELKTDIAKRFNKNGKYLTKKKAKLGNKKFENDYYNYNSVDKQVYKKQFNAGVDNSNSTTAGEHLRKAGFYKNESIAILFSSGLAAGGLISSDPIAATVIGAVGGLASFVLNIAGNMQLIAAGRALDSKP